MDQDTGLYYYGARYYDPRVSVWESADPVVGSYLNGQINAGVYNPVNLGLYTYTFNNPVKYNDPTGKWGVIGHYWVMYVAALAAGLGNKKASALAAAAWAPDTDNRNAMSFMSLAVDPDATGEFKNQMEIHSLTGGNAYQAQRAAKEKFETMLAGTDFENFSTGDENVAHLLGDVFAHTLMGDDSTLYSPGKGHLWGGTAPDNPGKHPRQFMRYAMTVYKLLRNELGTRGINFNMSPEAFKILMGRVIKAKNDKEREKILTEWHLLHWSLGLHSDENPPEAKKDLPPFGSAP